MIVMDKVTLPSQLPCVQAHLLKCPQVHKEFRSAPKDVSRANVDGQLWHRAKHLTRAEAGRMASCQSGQTRDQPRSQLYYKLDGDLLLVYMLKS